MEFTEITTVKDVCEVLGVSTEFLDCFFYVKKPHDLYNIFDIPKGRGGVRTISAPTKDWKPILTRLALQLRNSYNFPEYVTGFVKNKSIYDNALFHVNKRIVVNIDIKDFFPSINFGRVSGFFQGKPYNFNKSVSNCLAKICTLNGVLPQGAPTSPILSNMISYKMDADLNRYCVKYGISFSRYADDMTFSTNRENIPHSFLIKKNGVFELGDMIPKIIKKNGFIINNDKTYIAPRYMRQVATNLTINSMVNVNRKYIRDLRALFHSWSTIGLKVTSNRYFSKTKGYPIVENGYEKELLEVVSGKLSFLGMIRGKEDYVFQKFGKMYNDLTGVEIFPTDKIMSLIDLSRERLLIITNYSGCSQGTGFYISFRDKVYLVTSTHVFLSENGDKYCKEKFLSNPRSISISEVPNQDNLYSYFTLKNKENPTFFLDVHISESNQNSDVFFHQVSVQKVIPVCKKYIFSYGEKVFCMGYKEFYKDTLRPFIMETRTISESICLGRKMVNVHGDSIFHGMSGGPVLNEKHEVIGINYFGGDLKGSDGFIPIDQEIIGRLMNKEENL